MKPNPSLPRLYVNDCPLRYNEIQVNRMRLQLHRSCFQLIRPGPGVSTHGFAGCMGWGSAERPDVSG